MPGKHHALHVQGGPLRLRGTQLHRDARNGGERTKSPLRRKEKAQLLQGEKETDEEMAALQMAQVTIAERIPLFYIAQ